MTGHMPGHVRSLWSRSGGQLWGCRSSHILPSHVAPSQVHKSGNSLGNWLGDETWEIAIRWKNGVRTLQAVSSCSPVHLSYSTFLFCWPAATAPLHSVTTPSLTNTEVLPSSCHSWTPCVCTGSILNLIYALCTATMCGLQYVSFFFFFFAAFCMSHYNLFIFKYYLINGHFLYKI